MGTEDSQLRGAARCPEGAGAAGPGATTTFPRRSQIAFEPQPLVHLGVGEVHDGPLVSFLLQRALQERRKEEEKELEQARRELLSLLAVPAPRRTAEQEMRVRACQSVLLWSTRTTGFWETTLCFLIFAMLGTTVGTCTASAVSVHAASSSTTVVWLVMLVSMRLGCVPLGWLGPRFSASWPVWSRWTVPVTCTRLVMLVGVVQMDSSSDMHKAGYAGCDAPRAVFLSLVLTRMMLGIMACIDQKDSCSDMFKAGIAGDSAPRAVLLPFVRPMMLRIMAGMDQYYCITSLVATGDSAVAVHRRSSTILSCCRDSSPWSRLVGRP